MKNSLDYNLCTMYLDRANTSSHR